uniref:Uncharacterized protein n=1 Tax=Arion vulgaris TaxID=1028688 RepID=A0A0B7ACI3_9EUPU
MFILILEFMSDLRLSPNTDYHIFLSLVLTRVINKDKSKWGQGYHSNHHRLVTVWASSVEYVLRMFSDLKNSFNDFLVRKQIKQHNISTRNQQQQVSHTFYCT